MSLVNQAGLDLVEEYEQFREFAYPDPASKLARATAGMGLRWGFVPARDIIARLPAELAILDGKPWTVGFGETRGVNRDSRMSREVALTKKKAYLEVLAQAICDELKVKPNKNQLAAMTSMAYNVGLGWRGDVRPANAKDGFLQSSVRRNHDRGDFQAAARAFSLWNKAGGKVMAGLTRRRASEAALYLRPVDADGEELVRRETVEPERPMTKSSINRGAAVAGGTAAVATVAETARTVADIKDTAGQLGEWLVPILLCAVVALCGFIIWERLKQRKDGWA